MPQTLLPIFPAEATPINNVVSFAKREGVVYYFHGCQPVFSHGEHDLKSFRMFTSQLAVNGTCKQVEIVRAFGISAISMKRYVKKYLQGGAAAFYGQRRKPQPRVLTAEVMRQAQELFEQGESRSAVAQRLGLKTDTLSKAVRAGRLVESVKKTNPGARKASAA
jgi:transposase-like protein